jgi:hypothetical protein
VSPISPVNIKNVAFGAHSNKAHWHQIGLCSAASALWNIFAIIEVIRRHFSASLTEVPMWEAIKRHSLGLFIGNGCWASKARDAQFGS